MPIWITCQCRELPGKPQIHYGADREVLKGPPWQSPAVAKSRAEKSKNWFPALPTQGVWLETLPVLQCVTPPFTLKEENRSDWWVLLVVTKFIWFFFFVCLFFGLSGLPLNLSFTVLSITYWCRGNSGSLSSTWGLGFSRPASGSRHQASHWLWRTHQQERNGKDVQRRFWRFGEGGYKGQSMALPLWMGGGVT